MFIARLFLKLYIKKDYGNGEVVSISILVAGCADTQNFHLYIKIFQTLCSFANQAWDT